MGVQNNHKGILAILFTVLPLAGLAVLLNDTSIHQTFTSWGWKFSKISDWLPNNSSRVAIDTSIKISEIKKQLDTQTLASLDKKDKYKYDSLKKKNYFLSATYENTLLLEAFFRALSNSKHSLCRLWYYGDSQAEGDRISFHLRYLLQKEFGGSGMGLLPLSDVATFRNVTVKAGDAWLKYNVFNHLGKKKDYGFGGTFFIKNSDDSTASGKLKLQIGKGLNYQKLFLAHGIIKNGKLRIYKESDNTVSKEILLEGEKSFNKTLISQSNDQKNWTFELEGNGPIFGYLIEGNNGIQIDNLAIRGHSGDRLHYINNEMLVEAGKDLNVQLIIFHYGNNVIPYLKGREHVNYVVKEFRRLFNRYKKLFPHASILVIGSGDMGREIDDEATPYEWIPTFNNALELAALETGCAYFDLYTYMRNSGGILKWQEEGIAGLDGHLGPAGQARLAKVLYEELMREYQAYKIVSHL